MQTQQALDPQSISPQSDSDWTVHSLNIQGTFFERWCQETMKKSRWKVVSTNYPVEYPPQNGPFIGEQSTLDIYAQLAKESILLTLLVECKKHNPEFIDWVFFYNPNPDRPTHFTGSLIANKLLLDSANANKWSISSALTPMRSLDWVQTSDAWETRGDYLAYKKDRDKTRTSNGAISAAAHQIALATKSIMIAELENDKILSERIANAELPYQHQIFIPTIVTTAHLFTCKFEPKDVDQATGVIPFSKAQLTEQPYLLYEYPLPAHFRSEPLDKVGIIKSGNKDFGTRMDILVVNSNKFQEFLEKLEKGNA
jgi:hypothetical protein